jgi:hypothetical protein
VQAVSTFFRSRLSCADSRFFCNLCVEYINTAARGRAAEGGQREGRGRAVEGWQQRRAAEGGRRVGRDKREWMLLLDAPLMLLTLALGAISRIDVDINVESGDHLSPLQRAPRLH